MREIHIEYAADIEAPADTLYAILRDYEVGHSAILPWPYFADLTVTHGGQGKGTAYLLEMNVTGTHAQYDMLVTEPEPGHTLVETDRSGAVTTTLRVDALGDNLSRVTISSQLRASGGLQGVVEKLFNPLITRRIYRKELELLAAYAHKQANAG